MYNVIVWENQNTEDKQRFDGEMERTFGIHVIGYGNGIKHILTDYEDPSVTQRWRTSLIGTDDL